MKTLIREWARRQVAIYASRHVVDWAWYEAGVKSTHIPFWVKWLQRIGG